MEQSPTKPTENQPLPPRPKESLEALLNESFGTSTNLEGTVIKGQVISIDKETILVDIGLKSEGRVTLKEFDHPDEIKLGDTVDVFLERMEDKNGEAVLSREKAKHEEAWDVLEKAFQNHTPITGTIFARVKGGFTVDLSNATGFLPGSHVDIRPVRDITPLMGTPQPFLILKIDRLRDNIVISRRAVLEDTQAEAHSDLIATIQENAILQGIVKNITDYGAFVDLGGGDGLLHVTDIAWRRINHPSEILQIGQTVTVQVIRFSPETQRISLGMKQLEPDPWADIEDKYPKNTKAIGRVTNITEYGAFVELEPGIEGLIHISEMSWSKSIIHPSKLVSTSQEVEVMILNIDQSKRRLSLGLKQCLENPWETFLNDFPVGSEIEGTIKNIADFGLFIDLSAGIDGMVHLSDIDWQKSGEEVLAPYKQGDTIRVKVLDVDVKKERISLGIKQLTEDPFAALMVTLRKGSVVTCTVIGISHNGIDVSINDLYESFIRKAELAHERSEQRPEAFTVGQKIEAKVTQIDTLNQRIHLSIKASEIDEEKQAMAEYASDDRKVSLGEILGTALQKRQQTKEENSK